MRKLDVDMEARRLYEERVEIATLYYDPPADPDLGLYSIDYQRDLLAEARGQYARLASLPELAFLASSFDPVQAAMTLRNRGVLAREAAPGESDRRARLPASQREGKTRHEQGQARGRAAGGRRAPARSDP